MVRPLKARPVLGKFDAMNTRTPGALVSLSAFVLISGTAEPLAMSTGSCMTSGETVCPRELQKAQDKTEQQLEPIEEAWPSAVPVVRRIDYVLKAETGRYVSTGCSLAPTSSV